MLFRSHQDTPGVISAIATLLYEQQINIGNMTVNRSRQDHLASMYIEIDSLCQEDITSRIRQIPGMMRVKLLLPIEERTPAQF